MNYNDPTLQMLFQFYNYRFQLFYTLFEYLEYHIPHYLITQLQLAIQAEIEPDKREQISQQLLAFHAPPVVQRDEPLQEVQQFVPRNDKKRRKGFDGGDPNEEYLHQEGGQKCTFAYDSVDSNAIADGIQSNFIFAQRNEDCFMGIDDEFSSDNYLKYYNGVGSFKVNNQQVDVFFGTVRVRGSQ